jgi:hypothetical protein
MPLGQAFNLEHALALVTARLARRFPELDAETVRAVVTSFARAYGDARILTYVPVFVERHSVERLATLAADPSALTQSAVA